MEKREIKRIVGKNNATIFEIGCADGIDTQEFVNEFGKDLILHCFEPDPRNCKVFLEGGYRPINPSFTLPVEGCKIFFNQLAVGKIDGRIKMYQTSTIYSSSIKKPEGILFETWPSIEIKDELEVECVSLDHYVEKNEIGLIDFIWADIQGAEDYLILGGKKTFFDKVRYFYTEYAKNENSKYYENSPLKEDIKKLLGDDWEIIGDNGSDILLVNKKLIYDSN